MKNEAELGVRGLVCAPLLQDHASPPAGYRVPAASLLLFFSRSRLPLLPSGRLDSSCQRRAEIRALLVGAFKIKAFCFSL